jgi:ubiquinone/menaquinone biosynthesis C-methylase UbiE
MMDDKMHKQRREEKHMHSGSHQHSGKGSGAFVDTKRVISLILKEDGQFLDVGCGPGDYLKAASKLSNNITGIDMHEESISKVKGLGFNGIVADATKTLPFKDESFDAILLSNVLHGFVWDKTESSVLSELRRIIKKDGTLGIVEFKKNSIMGPSKDIKLSEKQVINTLEYNGFTRLSNASVGMFNYIITFKKK